MKPLSLIRPFLLIPSIWSMNQSWKICQNPNVDESNHQQTPPCLDHPELRSSPPFSAATRPRPSPRERPSWGTCWASAWHTPRGEPFPQRLRCPVRLVFGAPHGGAQRRQVYRRGSYLTKTKVDKISGDFQDFVSCISAGSSFRTNIIFLLSAWCCLLLIVRPFSCCFIEIPAHVDEN